MSHNITAALFNCAGSEAVKPWACSLRSPLPTLSLFWYAKSMANTRNFFCSAVTNIYHLYIKSLFFKQMRIQQVLLKITHPLARTANQTAAHTPAGACLCIPERWITGAALSPCCAFLLLLKAWRDTWDLPLLQNQHWNGSLGHTLCIWSPFYM